MRPFLLVMILLSAGCQSRRWECGAGIAAYPDPVVKMEMIEPTDKRAPRMYAVLLYPEPIVPLCLRGIVNRCEVVTRLTLASNGTVQEVTILKSTMPGFEDLVGAVAARWRFRPLPDFGATETIAGTVDYRVSFDFGGESQ